LSWQLARGRPAPGRARDRRGAHHDRRRLPRVVSGGDLVRRLPARARGGPGGSGDASMTVEVTKTFDPVLLAVLANRLDAICREMTNTLLRSGRSAVLNMARDFSGAIVTADNQLLASAQGLPAQVIGMEFLAEAMTDLHDEIAEGDAFLHNGPYLGNTHSADHAILVPVFHEGEHVFTACAKAHQADCGNSLPTTYMPGAR